MTSEIVDNDVAMTSAKPTSEIDLSVDGVKLQEELSLYFEENKEFILNKATISAVFTGGFDFMFESDEVRQKLDEGYSPSILKDSMEFMRKCIIDIINYSKSEGLKDKRIFDLLDKYDEIVIPYLS